MWRCSDLLPTNYRTSLAEPGGGGRLITATAHAQCALVKGGVVQLTLCMCVCVCAELGGCLTLSSEGGGVRGGHTLSGLYFFAT